MEEKIQNIIKKHQQKIVLAIGYVLIALLSFSVGKIIAFKPNPPDIKIEEPSPINIIAQNQGIVQSAEISNEPEETGDCQGKIKGNINSKGEKIYHMPNGAFYERTIAEMCFHTEAEAQRAGFRRSSR